MTVSWRDHGGWRVTIDGDTYEGRAASGADGAVLAAMRLRENRNHGPIEGVLISVERMDRNVQGARYSKMTLVAADGSRVPGEAR